MVRLTGLEPVTSAMSRQRSNQLSYRRFSAWLLFSVLLRDSGAHVIQVVWGLQAFFCGLMATAAATAAGVFKYCSMAAS